MKNFNLNKRTLLSCIIAILVFILAGLILFAVILELTYAVKGCDVPKEEIATTVNEVVKVFKVYFYKV